MIPLFILFANLGLVDNLVGLMIVYVASAMAVATWMMAAYMDSIPISLEEAAWIDGASLFRGFVQVVLRNSLPGVLSTAIFTFLVAWNDYLVAHRVPALRRPRSPSRSACSPSSSRTPPTGAGSWPSPSS